MDEKKRLGTDIPVERQSQLIKILIDHVSHKDSLLSYIRQALEKGGRPNILEAFNRKAMLAGGEIQKAVHCIDVCGFNIVSKHNKRTGDQGEFNSTTKKSKHNEKAQGRGSKPWNDQDRSSKTSNTNVPTTCKGCGKPDTGECLNKTHTDYNHSALPWHDSDMGKAYWAKGLPSLSKNPPYINGTEWVNKPIEFTTKDSSKQCKSHSGPRGKRGRGKLLASPLTNTHKDSVFMALIFVVLPHHRTPIQALIDTGSPSNYVSPTCAAWLQREGCQRTPSVQCVCSPLANNACACSEFQIHFNITLSKASEEIISLTAAIMPLSTYDLIIGYPIILQYDILDRLMMQQT